MLSLDFNTATFKDILPQFLAMVKDKNDPQTLINQLRKREFSISEAGISSRVFNFWMQKEIINIPKDYSSKWVKLNFVDYVWVCIVRDLRSIGIPTDIIKKIKDQIFVDMTIQFEQLLSEEMLREEYIKYLTANVRGSNEKEDSKLLVEKLLKELGEKKILDEVKKTWGTSFNQLEYALYTKQIFNFSASLIVVFEARPQENEVNEVSKANHDENIEQVFPKLGACLIWSDIYSELNPEWDLDTWIRYVYHILLPVDKYIEEFVTNGKNEIHSKRLGWLSSEEQQLIKLIRTKAPDQIEVKLKNNKIDLIEVVKYHKPELESKLLRHFGMNDYGEITWTYHDGKKQSIRIAEKFRTLKSQK